MAGNGPGGDGSGNGRGGAGNGASISAAAAAMGSVESRFPLPERVPDFPHSAARLSSLCSLHSSYSIMLSITNTACSSVQGIHCFSSSVLLSLSTLFARVSRPLNVVPGFPICFKLSATTVSCAIPF